MSIGHRRETTNSNNTTTPTNPPWVTNSQRNFNSMIDALGTMNPYDLVPGASPLQQEAYDRASNLNGRTAVVDRVGGGQVNTYDEAGRLITGATRAPANTAGQAAQATATGYAAIGYDPVGQAQTTGYQASGPAATQGYSAAGPAATQGYQSQAVKAAQLGPAQGYQAAQIGGGPINVKAGQAQASSLLQGLPDYMNPYTDSVVSTTLAGMDRNAAREKAAMDAQAGRDRAFGGSGYAIREGTFAADNNLNRAATEAGLRDTAFNTAAQLSNLDAARRTDVSQTNAGLTTNANIAGAGLSLQRDTSNMDALNAQRQFGANAQNQFAQTQAGFNQQANLSNAERADQAAAMLAEARNRSALDYTGRTDAASQFGADARNRASLDYAGRNDAASAFGANARNNAALDYAGRTDAASRYGADARNTASQFGAQAQNTMSQFNADANNTMARFNAGQQDLALQRQLQGAGLMQSLGNDLQANDRANIQLQAAIGAGDREIQRQYLSAPFEQLQLMGNLYSGIPYNLFNGSQSTGNSTTNQTGVSLDFARLLASAMGGGGGGSQAISDYRMKENIAPMGMGPSGDALYQFNYKGDPSGSSYVGPIAQEVAQTNPQAVSAGPDGTLSVDYNQLGLPTPQQQDGMRDRFAGMGGEDPLNGWSGNTHGQLAEMRAMDRNRMGAGYAPRPFARGSLFGGRG